MKFLIRGGPPLGKFLAVWLALLIVAGTGCASDDGEIVGDLDEPVTDEVNAYSDEQAFADNSAENESYGDSNESGDDLLADDSQSNEYGNDYNDDSYYNDEGIGEGNAAGYDEESPDSYGENNAYADGGNTEGYNEELLEGGSEGNPYSDDADSDYLLAGGDNPYAAEGADTYNSAGGADIYTGNSYEDTAELADNTYAAVDGEGYAGDSDISSEAIPYDGAASSDYMAAAGAPAGNLPEPGSKMHYIVQRGDTLANIAEKIYGDRELWREIQQLTGMENPHRIYPGEVVYYRLTEQSQAFAAAYENTPKGEIAVQAGDTLASLAQRIYGDPGEWQAVWRANDTIDNPDRLTVGQIVYFVNNSEVMAQQELWTSYFASLNEAPSAVTTAPTLSSDHLSTELTKSTISPQFTAPSFLVESSHITTQLAALSIIEEII